MKVSLLHIGDLSDYVRSTTYRREVVVPISPHRAISHSLNPRARAEDVALVLVRENDKLIGYLGVMPDELHLEGQVERCGWLSCMWVDPNQRGKGIAKTLINTVFEHWERRILVTSFTPSAKGLYDSTQQFDDLRILPGLRGYLRPASSRLLPAKSERWKKWLPLLQAADYTAQLFNSLRLALHPSLRSMDWELLHEWDEEAWAFVAARKQGELLNRSLADMQWITANPWILQAPQKDSNAERYHFSAVAQQFFYLPLKIWEPSGALAAVLLFSVRDGFLKIPYAYFDTPHTMTVMNAIALVMQKLRLHTFTTYQPRLMTWMEHNPTPFFKHRKVYNHYIVSKVFQLPAHIGSMSIQDGDADCAFT